MKLYYSPGACSLAPHIVLKEAGLSAELVKVDLATKTTADGRDYREVSPNGYVPALRLDDGQALTEASAILQYLAERKPESGLAPAAGFERYRFLEQLGFVATELHKGFAPLFDPATPAEAKRLVKEKLATRFAHLDRRLAAQTYLLGERFSAADAYAFTVVSWANLLKLDLGPYRNLRAYLARVAERPAVQAALKAEGLA